MGGFLTIGYCLRTIGFLRTTGYCFPYCFLKIYVGGQSLDGGDIVMMGDPPVSPLGKTLSRAKRHQLPGVGGLVVPAVGGRGVVGT